MKATATSDFHGSQINHVFINLKEGRNVRKMPKNACRGDGRKVCGCGYPCSRTSWELPEGFVVRSVREVGAADSLDYDYGHGYAEIEIMVDPR